MDNNVNGANIVAVSMQYTVTGSTTTLPAYSKTFTIDAAKTQNNVAGIVARFSWEQQNLAVGSGTFNATITTDSRYNVKRLDIDDDTAGRVVATFRYPRGGVSPLGTATLRVLPVIRDRMFGIADNNGNTDTHKFVYLPVTNTTTGRTWLNNNLGADYANIVSSSFNPAQQAKSSTDYLAYGSLFQWGRKADGHELINRTNNGTGGTGVNGITSTQSDEPTDARFITDNSSSMDWREYPDDTLRANESSPNNVCPVGYRLPTQGEEGTNKEWEVEVDSWHTDDAHDNTNATHALASTLKLSMPGYRDRFGDLRHMGIRGNYWPSSIKNIYAYKLYLVPIKTFDFFYRNTGLSVRCIKD